MPILSYLSPAKSLRFGSSLGFETALEATEPRLLACSKKLAKAMQAYDADSIGALMGISEALARQNAARFKDIDKPLTESNPECRRAVFCFNGEACCALRPEALDKASLRRLSGQTRFLSGYYGALRPMDLMRAYRLEMGQRPSGIGAKSLYEFWGDQISTLLIGDAREMGAREALSLASEEYDKAASASWSGEIALHRSRFETESSSGRKIISFDAKRARGLFARHLCSRDFMEVQDAAESFDLEGWRLDKAAPAELTGTREWIFVKKSS